jgi:hypothetical protein
MSKRRHVKYTLFLSGFNETLILLTDFWKKAQISSFVKIRPMGAELFHTDGRMNTTKLIVAFRNFANAPEKSFFTFTVYFHCYS